MSSVLVVEDAENWQRELKITLEAAGYKVKLVSSALDVIQAMILSGIPSLVIMDVSLTPGNPNDRQGLEMAKRIKGVPVLCTSSYLSADEVEDLNGQDIVEQFLDKNDCEDKRFLGAVRESMSSGEAKRRSEKSEIIRVCTLVRRIVVGARICVVVFVLIACWLFGLAYNNVVFWGHGRGFFMGLAAFCIGLVIECLIGLVILSRHYKVAPVRSEYGNRET